MEKINFLMGLHCHQPVDNFGSIFEEAYKKSYQPFLSVLERHPGIKLSLHYSGSLLEWLIENRPDFVDRIKSAVDRNQVEILTGGYFEPILSMIPPRDAKGQIEELTSLIERQFNCMPRGIWLTERVWDPALKPIFKDLNVKYAILDDFHLEQAGIERMRVFGRYSVKGFENFSVFASIKKLRYTIPFRKPELTIDFLKNLYGKSGVRCVTFADDCEKFGFWPYTYDWVYKKGWLERFFTSLEKNSWIKLLTFSEALEESESLGKIDIPHASYAEMIQWCEGNFNNFFAKYPESDLMRKRMLYVSRKISSYGDRCFSEEKSTQKHPSPHEARNTCSHRDIEKARIELYKSQSNCAYWHGIFSGIYVNYLRQGVYNHLIKAEKLLENTDTNTKIEMINFKDGEKNIICAGNKFLTLFINPSYAGSLFEMDYKPLSYNLVNTVSRRYEPYHEKLKRGHKIDIGAVKRKVDREDESVDLYEVLGVRERNLGRILNYDPYRKFSLLCHVMSLKTSLTDFIKSTHTGLCENSLFGPYNYEVEDRRDKLIINLQRDCNVTSIPVRDGVLSRTGIGQPYCLRLNKCIVLEKESDILIRFDLENISSKSTEFIFSVEFNWSIEDAAFMKNRRQKEIKRLTLVDRFCGIKIDHIFGEAVNIWSFPVYTVNESERGIGKNFQEISLLFYKRMALGAGEKFSLDTKVRISN